MATNVRKNATSEVKLPGIEALKLADQQTQKREFKLTGIEALKPASKATKHVFKKPYAKTPTRSYINRILGENNQVKIISPISTTPKRIRDSENQHLKTTTHEDIHKMLNLYEHFTSPLATSPKLVWTTPTQEEIQQILKDVEPLAVVSPIPVTPPDKKRKTTWNIQIMSISLSPMQNMVMETRFEKYPHIFRERGLPTLSISSPHGLTTSKRGKLKKELITHMLRDDIIENSESTWTTHVIIEKKFSSLMDIHAGYWQMYMNEADKRKTAFEILFGIYQLKNMQFGLKNATANLQWIDRFKKIHLSNYHLTNVIH